MEIQGKLERRNTYKIDLKKYELSKNLTDESFRYIYFVQEKETHKNYVAKVISYSKEKESYKQIINREVNVLMQIHQPTLINYIGYSLEDFDGKKNITILMEHIENGSLYDTIKKTRSKSSKTKLNNTNRQIILIGIAHGMMFLHQNHILHRELSPYNVLLDENLEPHLIDYGLSKIHLSEIPLYMSPETIKDNIYNEKTDVYSFGILMYELVTDKQPFSELINKVDEKEFKKSIIEKNVRPTFSMSIKKSIKELIERCWSQNPIERPTFDELFNKLAFNDWEVDFTQNECNARYFLDDVNYEDVFNYVDKISPRSKIEKNQISELKSKLNAAIEKLNTQDIELRNAKKEIEQLKKLQAQQKSRDSEEKTKNENKIKNLEKAIKILFQNQQQQKEEYDKIIKEQKEEYDKINKEQKKEYDKIIKEQKSQIQNLTDEIKSIKSTSQNPTQQPATSTASTAKKEQNSVIKYIDDGDDEDSDNPPDIFNKPMRNMKVYGNTNRNDSKIDLKGGFVKPFGIVNIGNTCYMNSSLQCLLSLSSFIEKLDSLIADSSSKSGLLSSFRSFISSHDPYNVKQLVGQSNEIYLGSGQQDSFEFAITFISAIHEECKKGIEDLFIGKFDNVSKCMKCKEEMKFGQDFSSLSLSIHGSRTILYLPFSLNEHPVNLAERPKMNSIVKIREIQSSQQIGKYIMVAKKIKKFEVIDHFDTQYPAIYAFEVPENVKKNNGLTVVQLKDSDGGYITSPFICEVPIGSKVSKDALKEIIASRLSPNSKSKAGELKKLMKFRKPTKFPHDFSASSEKPTFCSSYVNVELTRKDAVSFTQRTIRNQRQDMSLSQLFEGHIKQSQLEFPCKFTCDFCKEKSRVYQRIKYKKLPKILIVQIKRSKGFYDDSVPDDTGVSLPRFISIDLNGEFDVMKTGSEIGSRDVKYELMAVSDHSGSFNFGHYTADAKRGDKWYNFNDSFVSDGHEPNGPSSNVYAAFYQQVS